MGTWEEKLRVLASSAADVSPASASEMRDRAKALQETLTSAAENSGLTGAAGDAANASFNAAAANAQSVADTLQSTLTQLASANSERQQSASTALTQLPGGSAPGWLQDLVGGAAAGSLVALPILGAGGIPLAISAGEAAVGALNGLFASFREDAAQAAVKEISEKMDGYASNLPIAMASPKRSGIFDANQDNPNGPDTSLGNGSFSGGFAPIPRSFDQYPGAGTLPSSQFDHGGLITQHPAGHAALQGYAGPVWTTGVVVGPSGDLGAGDYSSWGDSASSHDGNITADGPIAAGSTALGSDGISSTVGGGGLAGGATNGLMAGIGGAAALGGARLASKGASGGSRVGIGSTPKGSGGLLGGANGGQGGVSAASAAEAGGAGRGNMSMLGAPGMAGGQSQEKKQRRGLGLFAPQFEEDEEPQPRSAAAGPGGRD